MWQRRGGAGGEWRLDAYGAWTWQAAPREGVPGGPGGRRAAEPLRSVTTTPPTAQPFGRVPDAAPEPADPSRGGWEPTPIFRAIVSEWERHQHDDIAGHRRTAAPAGERSHAAPVPGPRLGSGPLPVQRLRDASRTHDLAPVPVVPPPPHPGGSPDRVGGHRPDVGPSRETGRPAAVPGPRLGSGPLPVQRLRDASSTHDLVPVSEVPAPPPWDESPEDELRRRAQRRRRPLTTTSSGGGRHALRPRGDDRPTSREDRNTLGAGANVLTFDPTR